MKTIQIVLDKRLLEAADQAARRTRQNRSALVRDALREHLRRLEVRLYQFASPDKRRPVVVLTRDSAMSYLSTVTVAPITSTIRDVPSEVVLTEEDGMKAPCAVNLHNAVTIAQARLGRRVAQLSSLRMSEICAALRFSLGCEPGQA
jgi:mRNA interferase MazF